MCSIYSESVVTFWCILRLYLFIYNILITFFYNIPVRDFTFSVLFIFFPHLFFTVWSGNTVGIPLRLVQMLTETKLLSDMPLMVILFNAGG